jgi:hypothetical protein
MERVQVDRKTNSAVLNLNTKLYKVEKILKVAQSFSEACYVDVGGDVEGVIQVKLKPKTKNLKASEVGYEFFNHVLAEMKADEL